MHAIAEEGVRRHVGWHTAISRWASELEARKIESGKMHLRNKLIKKMCWVDEVF